MGVMPFVSLEGFKQVRGQVPRYKESALERSWEWLEVTQKAASGSVAMIESAFLLMEAWIGMPSAGFLSVQDCFQAIAESGWFTELFQGPYLE